MSSPVSPSASLELTVRDLTERLASRAPTPGRRERQRAGRGAGRGAGRDGLRADRRPAGVRGGRPHRPPDRGRGRRAAGRLLDAAEEDAAAYDRVAEARRLPRETDEEKAARKAAIAEASVAATEVPLRVMRLALDVLDLAARMAPIGNRNAISDAGSPPCSRPRPPGERPSTWPSTSPPCPRTIRCAPDGARRLAELEPAVAKREGEALAAVRQRIAG